MNVHKLRKNKMKAVAMLRKKGVSVRQTAILLYGDDSESAQKRVAALLSKSRKKLELTARKQAEQPQPSGHQPQPQLLNLKNTNFTPQPQPQNLNVKTPTFAAQPQPEKANKSKGDGTITGDKIIDEEHEAQGVKHPETVEKGKTGVIKHPEMVEKGKAAVTVFDWLDEDELARDLADECYEKAKKCYEDKDYENTCRFMELVSRFLKLSQTARREFDIEELKKAVEEDEQALEEDE